MGTTDREKWDSIYRQGHHADAQAPAWLEELDERLPRVGQALDVAAGTGAVARWLARRGLDVLAVDVSAVGLGLLKKRAADDGVLVETRVLDLEHDPLPKGPYQVVACFHYLQRDLFGPMRARLAPGGVLLAETATVTNLERHERPSRKYLLEPQEMLQLADDLQVLHYREGWIEGRHVAQLAARRR